MSRKTTRPPVKVSGWFFYVDLLTKHKNECKQRQKEQTKGHYILKIEMIFHSITPILKNRGQPTPQHGYPSLYYNAHTEHKQSVILHKKTRRKIPHLSSGLLYPLYTLTQSPSDHTVTEYKSCPHSLHPQYPHFHYKSEFPPY